MPPQRSTAGKLDDGWHDVESSWVSSARYDRAKRILWIATKTGAMYPWAHDIPPEKARLFFRAGSHGKWIWKNYPPGSSYNRRSKPKARPARRRPRQRK